MAKQRAQCDDRLVQDLSVLCSAAQCGVTCGRPRWLESSVHDRQIIVRWLFMDGCGYCLVQTHMCHVGVLWPRMDTNQRPSAVLEYSGCFAVRRATVSAWNRATGEINGLHEHRKVQQRVNTRATVNSNEEDRWNAQDLGIETHSGVRKRTKPVERFVYVPMYVCVLCYSSDVAGPVSARACVHPPDMSTTLGLCPRPC